MVVVKKDTYVIGGERYCSGVYLQQARAKPQKNLSENSLLLSHLPTTLLAYRTLLNSKRAYIGGTPAWPHRRVNRYSIMDLMNVRGWPEKPPVISENIRCRCTAQQRSCSASARRSTSV